MIDRKEVFSNTYWDALEDGKSRDEAEKIANQCVTDFESELIDEAMNRLKEA